MAIHAQNSVSLNTKPAKTSLLGGHFIYRVDTSQGTLTPSSANIIENVNDSPTLWGYNTHIGAGGIKLRYNQIDLSTWTKDGVTLYYPKYNSSNIPIQGDAAAILNTTGLKVQKGGVIAGTAGQNGFVYLSSEDYQLKDATHNGFTINGHTPTAAGIDDKLIDDPAWREIIGTKFGVDSEGNLYASNANISGKIIATEGEIGGCTIDSNGHLIVPSAYIDGTLTVTTIEGGVFNTNNYIRLSSEDSQTISINNSGNKTDWRIIAGNTFGVDKAGNLYATSAHVNGEIEATTGLIGGNDGWHIGTSAIYSGSHSTYNTPNVNGIFLGKESSNYYISGGPGAKWWIKDDGTFQLGTSGISYDGSTVTFGSNVTMPTLTVDTITGGTAGQSGYTYLSKNDNGTNLDIAGSGNKSNWRLVVGTNFGVDNAGNLYASNASISGAITAISGTIGGWQIGTDTNKTLHNGSEDTTPTVGIGTIILSKGLTSTTSVGGSSGSKTWAITAGTGFGITTSGEIYANSGVIGGCAISNGELQVSALNITSGVINSVRIPELAISKITDLSSSLTSAANTANSYIYYSSSALKIAQSNPSSTTTNYVQISSGGVDIVQSSTYKASITSSGLKVYAGNSNYDVATFGSTLRMGPSNSDHIQISSSQFQFCDGSGPYGYIEGDYGSVLTIGTYSTNNNLWLQTKRTSIGMYGTGEWEFVGRSASYDFDFQNSRLKNAPSYSSTDSSAANVYIGSGGRFNRSTHGSSERFKNSISKLTKESLLPKHLLDIEIIQYKYNDTELTNQNDFRRGELLPGYIAEQVQKVYPIAVDIDENGKAMGVNSHYLIPGMLALIQELNQRINKLEENK